MAARDDQNDKDRRSQSDATHAFKVFGVVLDYLKILMWPAVIVVIILVFKTDLKSLIGRIKTFNAPGFSATLGTDGSKDAARPPGVPDVYFSLTNNIPDSICRERADNALRNSGFHGGKNGEVSFGYSDKFVGAIWCRPENPTLITVAGPEEGLAKKQSELDKYFHGQSP